MSQSNKRSRGNPSGSRTPRKSSTPPVARQPARRASQSPLKANVNRTLPPFTTRRYLAIWIAGIVPLAIVLFLLTQFNKSSTNPAQATATVVPTALSASDAAGAVPPSTQAANPPQPTNTPAAASLAVSPTVGGPGKYMIIDTAKGRITAKLHTEPAAGVSKTIANFEQKANSKYFDGLNFHRVENWVIQGGDPKGDGTGGGTMPSEYNKLPFKAGALGVARGQDPAINNDSQFFIVKTDADYLDGQYTNFGQVIDSGSMNVANQIAIGDKITSIRVENR
jgi:peptidyl-prolyl cis-trans isomerase B (cyclophilin B)